MSDTHDGERPYDPETLERRPEVDPSSFFELDIRLGRVVGVAPFPEARVPAWKLDVDFGPVVGTLRTSAQITNYDRDELLGRRVIGVINLGTKRIAGFESQFLVLGTLDPDGTVRLLEGSDEAPSGAPVA